jgi:dienelactone hydrolase
MPSDMGRRARPNLKKLARLCLALGLVFALANMKDRTQAGEASVAMASQSLVQARSQFTTKIINEVRDGYALLDPPDGVFTQVQYDSPVGKLAAYITPDLHDGVRRPAIIWIHGGDCNSIGDVWSPQPPDNDQSAAAYRQSGIVMMFPSLRGGNQNPGVREAGYGELNDIIAAADYLARQPDVDSSRIYLGGHTTGATLTLLVSEYTNRFRAIFCFAPRSSIANYKYASFPLTFDKSNQMEVNLRAPYLWLSSIKSPTFVLVGGNDSDAREVRYMAGLPAPPPVHFYVVPNMTHYTILAPANAMIANKILNDTGPTTNIQFTQLDIDSLGLQ